MTNLQLVSSHKFQNKSHTSQGFNPKESHETRVFRKGSWFMITWALWINSSILLGGFHDGEPLIVRPTIPCKGDIWGDPQNPTIFYINGIFGYRLWLWAVFWTHFTFNENSQIIFKIYIHIYIYLYALAKNNTWNVHMGQFSSHKNPKKPTSFFLGLTKIGSPLPTFTPKPRPSPPVWPTESRKEDDLWSLQGDVLSNSHVPPSVAVDSNPSCDPWLLLLCCCEMFLLFGEVHNMVGWGFSYVILGCLNCFCWQRGSYGGCFFFLCLHVPALSYQPFSTHRHRWMKLPSFWSLDRWWLQKTLLMEEIPFFLGCIGDEIHKSYPVMWGL